MTLDAHVTGIWCGQIAGGGWVTLGIISSLLVLKRTAHLTACSSSSGGQPFNCKRGGS